ncbi:acyltransferase family protein [Nonomuraea antimicrobica]
MTSASALPVADAAVPRLAWLDALRGIGALAVVMEHLLPWFVPALRPYWFSLGIYGILVFFLVSGYIIPASLERHGDVRAFWISRFFRLYPLYLAVIALVLALAWWVPVRAEVPRDGSAVAAHATMLLDVVSVGGVADTMWTLSYEMVFYLVVTALFLTRGTSAAGCWRWCSRARRSWSGWWRRGRCCGAGGRRTCRARCSPSGWRACCWAASVRSPPARSG